MPRRHRTQAVNTEATTTGIPRKHNTGGFGAAGPAAPAENAGATCKHANADNWREYDVGKLHYLAFVVVAKQPQTSRCAPWGCALPARLFFSGTTLQKWTKSFVDSHPNE
jgi:hypothetical protein